MKTFFLIYPLVFHKEKQISLRFQEFLKIINHSSKVYEGGGSKHAFLYHSEIVNIHNNGVTWFMHSIEFFYCKVIQMIPNNSTSLL